MRRVIQPWYAAWVARQWQERHGVTQAGQKKRLGDYEEEPQSQLAINGTMTEEEKLNLMKKRAMVKIKTMRLMKMSHVSAVARSEFDAKRAWKRANDKILAANRLSSVVRKTISANAMKSSVAPTPATQFILT